MELTLEKLNMSETISGDERCPFIKENHKECHTSKMTSQAVVKVIEYCLENHATCEIYIRLKENGQAG